MLMDVLAMLCHLWHVRVRHVVTSLLSVCVYVYIHMYVCTYVCMYVCMYALAHTLDSISCLLHLPFALGSHAVRYTICHREHVVSGYRNSSNPKMHGTFKFKSQSEVCIWCSAVYLSMAM